LGDANIPRPNKVEKTINHDKYYMIIFYFRVNSSIKKKLETTMICLPTIVLYG